MNMRKLINLVEKSLPTVRPQIWSLTNEMIDEDIIAYHGSPHDFDKFDMSKIGTGEGAQAFGHGLYFTDTEEIATNYRDNISYQQSIRDKGWISPEGLSPDQATDAKEYLSKFWGQFDPSYILQSARESARELPQAKAYRDQLEDSLVSMKIYFSNKGLKSPSGAMGTELQEKYPKIVLNLQNDLESANRSVSDCELAARVYPMLLQYGIEAFVPRGSLYKVRIKADPGDFIDWDKPLSDQSRKVQEAIMSHMQEPDSFKGPLRRRAQSVVNGDFSDVDVASAIALLGGYNDANGAAQTLLKVGIPGIKYLDGLSRKDGKGAYNYVIFDDNLIEIIKKM